MPYLSSNLRITSPGRDAPPETHTRRAERSRPETSASASACSIVGTPPTTVTRSTSRVSSTTFGSNLGRIASEPPWRNETPMTEDSPKTWKKGRTASVTSSLRAPKRLPPTEQFM